jgi:hypothetical protein
MKEFGDLPSIEPGLYQHYKGGKYKVLGVGCNTEAHEYYVVYSPAELRAGIPEFWLRPYSMFMETVEIGGKAVPRFKKLMD